MKDFYIMYRHYTVRVQILHTKNRNTFEIFAQVVSLHCNLDDKTKHLINTDRLSKMKKDALLINASRGPVVDEVALVKHLQANPDFR